MELWYTELQTKNLGLTCKTKATLFTGRSPYQEVAVIDTEEFGRMLVLDGLVQATVRDEYIYHEMIAHVPLFTHPQPQRVLVIGGGDGGTVREVVKHDNVARVELAEIDGMVVDACRRYLPETAAQLDNPRVQVKIGDGLAHVKQARGVYDVIIVDCSEPIGPGEGLFARPFYQDLYAALKDDGLFVEQTESPFYNSALIRRVYRDISAVFPLTRLYTANIPTYPGGLWTFTVGSKKYDPLAVAADKLPDLNCRYYTPALHHGAFVLPKFVQDLLGV